jgi:hypothetical protein
VSADPVKSAFCSIVNSRHLGEESSTVLSIDMDFEPTPNVSLKRHCGHVLGVYFVIMTGFSSSA